MHRTTLGLAAACLALAGCATIAAPRLLRPEMIDASSVALRSVALGISDFRSERDVRGLCVGTQYPVGEVAEWQSIHAGRIVDTAPMVVPGQDCRRASDNSYVVADGRVPAFQLSPGEASFQTADWAYVYIVVGVDAQQQFSYDCRVARNGDRWETIECFCNPDPQSGLCVSIDPGITGLTS